MKSLPIKVQYFPAFSKTNEDWMFFIKFKVYLIMADENSKTKYSVYSFSQARRKKMWELVAKTHNFYGFIAKETFSPIYQLKRWLGKK